MSSSRLIYKKSYCIQKTYEVDGVNLTNFEHRNLTEEEATMLILQGHTLVHNENPYELRCAGRHTDIDGFYIFKNR